MSLLNGQGRPTKSLSSDRLPAGGLTWLERRGKPPACFSLSHSTGFTILRLTLSRRCLSLSRGSTLPCCEG